jgi:hypothetical protein
MKLIEIPEIEKLAPLACQHCGALLRLIGSEPHPFAPRTELLTYCCTACEEFFLQSIKPDA